MKDIFAFSTPFCYPGNFTLLGDFKPCGFHIQYENIDGLNILEIPLEGIQMD